MKWHRERPGRYTAGPYAIEDAGHHRPLWTATGPGMPDRLHSTKVDAQADCEDAALERIVGNEVTVPPVVGDAALVADTRRGVVTTMLAADSGVQLWCIKFARGRRLCLRRTEFEVVLP